MNQIFNSPAPTGASVESGDKPAAVVGPSAGGAGEFSISRPRVCEVGAGAGDGSGGRPTPREVLARRMWQRGCRPSARVGQLMERLNMVSTIGEWTRPKGVNVLPVNAAPLRQGYGR